MASADFIPTGRTSLVKRGDTKIQVQTEYAYRPVPRITTTVLKSGQVLHKVERQLDKPIDSLEEKRRTEGAIRKQHAEILGIIEKKDQPADLVPQDIAPTPPVEEGRTVSAPKPDPEVEEKEYPYVPTPDPVLSTEEQLGMIPGIQQVYRLDYQGNFHQGKLRSEFKKQFSRVFKSLSQLLLVFTEIPGVGVNREQGVYEIERDRLYLVSSGVEFFVCYLKAPRPDVDYEKAMRAVLPQQDVW